MGWTVYNSDGKILQSAELGDNSVTNAKVATGIDAVKLADGSVTNAELQYINSLSSNAQTQITAKAAVGSVTPSTQAHGDSAATGSSAEAARVDHKHAMPAAASVSEVNTGTSSALAVTPDSLAGSVYGEKNIQMVVIDWTTALTTGSKFYFYVPATLNGFHVVSAHAAMITAPAGSSVLVDIEKVGLDNIFDTQMQIAAGTIASIDSGSGVWTLDSTHKILATGQILRVDINQIGSSTAGSGLYINLTCRRP